MKNVTLICTLFVGTAISPLFALMLTPSTAFAQSASYRESVVLVRTELHGSGSGVVIDPVHVVTADHVIANDSKIRVEAGNSFITARVIARDSANDIAILRLDEPINKPALIVRDQPLTLSEAVTMIGHAEGKWAVTESTGKVLGIQIDQDAVSWIRVSVPVFHGMSGGPAIDATGNVVAIIVAVTLEDSKPTHAMLAPNHALVKLVAQINQVVTK